MPSEPSFDRWVFERAIRESTLTAKSRLIALVLSTRARRRSGLWIMLSATLASETGLSRMSVFRGLAELEKNGFLKRLQKYGRRGQRASAYQLLIPGEYHADTHPKSHSDTRQGYHGDTPYQPLYRKRAGINSTQQHLAAMQAA